MKQSRAYDCWSLLSVTAISFLSIEAAELRVPAEYSTISNAVSAAASGDTIRIAKGDYYEQFVIVNRRNLTLQGEPGAILHASAEMEQTLLPHDGLAYALVGVVRGSEVTFRELEFQGEHLADYYAAALTAIVFRGSSGRIENCTFQGFRGDFATESRAVNVENHLRDGQDTSYIGIFNSTFSDNKASVVLGGSSDDPGILRTTFSLEGNTITGAQIPEVTSLGIAIRVGAQGIIRGNKVSDHSWALGVVANDTDFMSRGQFFPLQRIVFSENVFSNNAVHLAGIAAYRAVVTNNVFGRKAPGFQEWGVTLTGRDLVVADNNFEEMPQGIALPAGEQIEGISRGAVVNPRLANNWFLDVATPVVTNATVTGLQETGNQGCCLGASFQNIARGGDGKLRAAVRGWHGDELAVEGTGELKQWSLIGTNFARLPVTEIELPHRVGAAQQYFRLRKNP